jgi:hypothetical protein
MDFVKWPWKRDAIADYFIASTVSILPAGNPKKMWVRISSSGMGIEASPFGEGKMGRRRPRAIAQYSSLDTIFPDSSWQFEIL